MEQYISKTALVAEIDKGINGRNDWQLDEYRKGYHDALTMFKKYLSSLEVKEVDLEKESLTWKDIPKIFTISEELKTSWWFVDRTKDIGTQAFWEEVLNRFKAQKGE